MTTFFVEQAIGPGEIRLDEAAAHHAHVKRLSVGDSVSITDGRGSLGIGQIAVLGKNEVVAMVDRVRAIAAPAPIHVFVPVADRDRMLWLAEKAAELQITSWSPILYQRSKSVTPRGEGDLFHRKVRARMISALEQSGGAWLPTLHPECEPAVAQPSGHGFLLERGGPTLGRGPRTPGPISLIIGPEGGFVAEEVAALDRHGWKLASLGDVTLRFETAAVAAIAVARALLAPEGEG